VEHGAKPKRYGDGVGPGNDTIGAEDGLEWPSGRVPAVTFSKEDAGQAGNQAVAAGVVDKVAFVVVDAGLARSPRIALLLALLAV
jgi:hypothetical protein